MDGSEFGGKINITINYVFIVFCFELEQHVVDQGGQTLAKGMVDKLITLEQRRRRRVLGNNSKKSESK